MSSMFVGMMFSRVVLAKCTFLGRHHTESVQFQQIVDFLESGCVDFFLSVSDSSSYTTPLFCLSDWVPPRKIVYRHQTQPFLRLPQRSSTLFQSRRRHSRARQPVLSKQTQFQQGELSDSYWQTPTDTKEVLKMQLQTDCPQGLHLGSARNLYEIAWLIHCFSTSSSRATS